MQFQCHFRTLPLPESQDTGQSHVLDDYSIHSCIVQRCQIGKRGRHLPRKHQRIHRHKSLDSMPVQIVHQPGEILQRKIVGPQTGIELLQTEIDGVRPIAHGRTGTLPVSGRSQQFRAQIASGQRRATGRIGLHVRTLAKRPSPVKGKTRPKKYTHPQNQTGKSLESS